MAIETLNLVTPPGFRGLDPRLPIRTYRRRLPHWRQVGASYFVTFRLADSIPQGQLKSLKRWRSIWELRHPEPRTEEAWRTLARETTRKTEAWLDEGYGECVFQDAKIAREMSQSLLHFQDSRCLTTCFVVMHNHVHAVIKPLAEYELEDILDSVKGYISRKVNRLFDRTGRLWEPESYDQIVRDDDHLYRVIQYIGNNPKRAGYARDDWVRWIHPVWAARGWGFRDGP